MEYFYAYASEESASKKAEELDKIVESLKTLPERGSIEITLQHLKKKHRYLLFNSTSRNTVKIIYFVDKRKNVVYVTDFFPTQMDKDKVRNRNTQAFLL